jgi:lipid-A-disaccharide synthase
MPDPPTFLFSTYEPSGDALAAGVIKRLLERRPDAKIYALAGSLAEAAGAELLESTTQHASMLFDTFKHVWSHRQRLKRLRAWLKEHRITTLVPTDSPAANWSICAQVRREQPHASIMHLAAPQLWAWAPWRIGKLRRLTDHVMCLLPFEPDWFTSRGVDASFVGHPLFESPDPQVEPADDGHIKLALLPGSRTGEIEKNWPTMLAVFDALKRRHASLEARVAAHDQRIASMIRAASPDPMPDGISLCVGQTRDALDWSDVVLAKSGTVTLEVASRRRPMVVMYNVSWWGYQTMGRWLLTTTTLCLPNLISEWQSGERAVPELMPHFGAAEPVIDALEPLLNDASARQRQCDALDRVVSAFESRDFSVVAADRLLGQSGRLTAM